MLFRNLPPRALERLGSMVVDIQASLPHRHLAHLVELVYCRNSIRYLVQLSYQASISSRLVQVISRHRSSPKSLIPSSLGP